jgi:hypothetical protein
MGSFMGHGRNRGWAGEYPLTWRRHSRPTSVDAYFKCASYHSTASFTARSNALV